MTKIREDQSLVSTIVSAAIDRLAPRKTQKELAREMGFLKPGMLSMIKTGAARIPFTKLPNVAAALDIDPALLIRTHLCETWPEFEDGVHEVFGGVHTEAERDWIEFFEGMACCRLRLTPRCERSSRRSFWPTIRKRRAKQEGDLDLATLGVADHLSREKDRNPVMTRALLDQRAEDRHCLNQNHPGRTAPGCRGGCLPLALCSYWSPRYGRSANVLRSWHSVDRRLP